MKAQAQEEIQSLQGPKGPQLKTLRRLKEPEAPTENPGQGPKVPKLRDSSDGAVGPTRLNYLGLKKLWAGISKYDPETNGTTAAKTC